MPPFCADPRLGVVDHPSVGLACVATTPLARHDRVYYWGDAVPLVDDTEDDYLLTPSDAASCLDPRPHGRASALQYANSPGPNEVPNVAPTRRVVRSGALVAQEFQVLRHIPRGGQVVWTYGGDAWFRDRGLRRVDVGTDALPVTRRGRRRG